MVRGMARHGIKSGTPKDQYDQIHLQFRAEAFNVVNRANFATPVSGANGNANVESVSAANFGRITAAGDPRVYQFGLKLMR